MRAGLVDDLPSEEENGNLYQYLLRQEDAETLEVACVTLAPGNQTRTASHPDEEELYLFLKGSALLRIGEEERQVSAGGFAYVPRNSVHSINNNGSEPFRYIYVANFPDRPGKIAPES